MVAILALCWSVLALGGDASGALRAHPSVGFEPVPRSVATDPDGNVYLSNPQSNGQVQKFTSDGTLLARWGHFGSGREYYPYPRDIATDPAGNVYVADSNIGRLRVFTSGGNLIRQWRASAWDVAVDAGGYVYVINRIHLQKFTPDGSLVAMWGSSGHDDGQFGEPWGIATGASGNVYVADTYNNRIQVFTVDGSFVTAWGNYGHDPGQLILPYGIATDPTGNVYVADTGNNRIQKFTPGGGFIAAWGSPGRSPGRFLTPTSVATDPDGNVYVADAGEPYPDGGAARIQKFTPNGEFITQWWDAPALPRPGRPKIFTALRGKTTRRTAVFRFRSRQRDIHFQCRLKGKRVPRKLRFWRRCASPKRYAGLRPGGKAFQVRAVKDVEAGRAATRTWRIVKRGRRRSR